MADERASEALDLIAVTRSGLEAVAARELRAMGYDAKPYQPGRVHLAGDLRAMARANIGLRTAERVLIGLARFECRDFGVLFDTAASLAWERWIPRGAMIHVNGRCVRSRLSSAPACQGSVKKAIVERLKRAWGAEMIEEREPRIVVEIEIHEDHASLTIDTTGPSLHKRGYRDLVAEAPLKETIAAAMILLAGWTPEHPLIDPFCGSGTIPIEAALIARGIAPGLSRPFAAESWGTIEPGVWAAAREEARGTVRRDLPTPHIAGYDIDEEALSLARRHAERAGVAADVHFQRRAFAELRSSRRGGFIITNPPWGERLGDQRAARALAESMPAVFNRLPAWSISVLTAQADFEEAVGRIADRRRKLHNGTIECTLFHFRGEAHAGEREDAAPRFFGRAGAVKSPAAARAASPAAALESRTMKQAELFRNRLSSRVKHLRKWAAREGLTCYRLYDLDIPEVPLRVERYGDRLLIVDIFGPRGGRSPAEHGAWIDEMARIAAEVAGTPIEGVIVRREDGRRVGSPESPHGKREARFTVEERGVRVEVDLLRAGGTGLPMELRGVRDAVRRMAPGRVVLDALPPIGVCAAVAEHAGAARAATVDEEGVRGRHGRGARAAGLSGSEAATADVQLLVADGARPDEAARLADRLAAEGVILLVTPHGAAAPVLDGFTARDLSRRMAQDDLREAATPGLWQLRRSEPTVE